MFVCYFIYLFMVIMRPHRQQTKKYLLVKCENGFQNQTNKNQLLGVSPFYSVFAFLLAFRARACSLYSRPLNTTPQRGARPTPRLLVFGSEKERLCSYQWSCSPRKKKQGVLSILLGNGKPCLRVRVRGMPTCLFV